MLPDESIKFYGHFLWIGFNCLKGNEPLGGDSLLLTFTFHNKFRYSFDQPRRMKDWIAFGATQWICNWDTWIGNLAP